MKPPFRWNIARIIEDNPKRLSPNPSLTREGLCIAGVDPDQGGAVRSLNRRSSGSYKGEKEASTRENPRRSGFSRDPNFTQEIAGVPLTRGSFA